MTGCIEWNMNKSWKNRWQNEFKDGWLDYGWVDNMMNKIKDECTWMNRWQDELKEGWMFMDE